MFELVFYRSFEAGHRLIEEENRKTICTQPHGHTWNVKVYLSCIEKKTLDHKENTLVFFSSIKTKWHTWLDNHIDHSFIFNNRDPLLQFMIKDHPAGRHVVVPGDPTTEMLAVVLKAKLDIFLKNLSFNGLHFICHRLILNETRTNGIIFSGDPKDHLPLQKEEGKDWWFRNDFSTNNLS